MFLWDNAIHIQCNKRANGTDERETGRDLNGRQRHGEHPEFRDVQEPCKSGSRIGNSRSTGSPYTAALRTGDDGDLASFRKQSHRKGETLFDQGMQMYVHVRRNSDSHQSRTGTLPAKLNYRKE